MRFEIYIFNKNKTHTKNIFLVILSLDIIIGLFKWVIIKLVESGEEIHIWVFFIDYFFYMEFQE